MQLNVYLPGVAQVQRRDARWPTPPQTGTSNWNSVLLVAPQTGMVWVCLQGKQVRPAALQMVDSEQHIERELDYRTLIAGSIAVILAMSMFAFSFWIVLRDSIYLRYLGHILAFLVFAGLNDWALAGVFEHFPGAPESTLLLRGASMAVSVALTLSFARQFLDLAQQARRADRLLGGIVWIMLVFGVLEVASNAVWGRTQSTLLLAENLAAGLACLTLMATSVRLAWRGHRSARYFCVAWFPFLTVAIASILLIISNDEAAQLVRNLQIPAAAFEAFMLSIGLADRTLSIKRERDAALSLSEHDALTGAWNRRGFERLFDERRRAGQAGTLMICDLDHFKRINDTVGHAIGDLCLQAFAQRAQQTLPSAAVVGRHGGEEFVVLISETDAAALALAEALRQAICEAPVRAGEISIPLTVSIGLVNLATANLSLPLYELIGQADTALYRAKAEGRNRVVVAPPA